MIATADAIYLPVPISYPSLSENCKGDQNTGVDCQRPGRHRIYRLPRHDQQMGAYARNGSASGRSIVGTIIDIRV